MLLRVVSGTGHAPLVVDPSMFSPEIGSSLITHTD